MGKHKVGLQRVLNQHKRAEEARYLPQLSQVYKIIKSIGQNIFECEAAISRDISDVNNQEQKKVHLCELNRKLRNVIWLKRGTFVLVEPYDRAMKIVGEITRVIEKSELKELGLLATSECKNVEQESGTESDNSQDLMFENPNRLARYSYSSDEYESD